MVTICQRYLYFSKMEIKSRIPRYFQWYFLFNFQDWIPERRHELIKQYKIRGIENEDDIAFNLTKDVTDEYYSRYFFFKFLKQIPIYFSLIFFPNEFLNFFLGYANSSRLTKVLIALANVSLIYSWVRLKQQKSSR